MLSVAERVAWIAQRAGLRPALLLPGQTNNLVSYVRLAQFIDAAASRLRAESLRSGQTVALLFDDSLLHIVLLLAAERLGIATVSVSARQAHLPLGYEALLTDVTGVGIPSRRIISVDRTWTTEKPQVAPPVVSELAENLPCRILLTSGSTGEPKAVELTYGMVDARLRSYEHVFGPDFPLGERTLCCMGLGTSVGYLLLLYTLQRGGLFCVPDRSIDITFRKLALYDLSTIVASTSSLLEMVAYVESAGGGFSQIKLVLTAGSLLSNKLAKLVRRRLCPNLVTFYGSTEAGVVASSHADVLELQAGEVGAIVPGMIVEVQPVADELLPAGRIRIRGAANARGYIGAIEDAHSSIRDGWFYPGDLGWISPDGILAIKGRETDIVNLGGHKTTLQTIESELAQCPGVAAAAAVIEEESFGIGQVVAVLVTQETWSEDRFRAYCKERVSRPYWPSRLVETSHLPLLPSGKIDRAAVRHLVEEHTKATPDKA
jgi:acyl-coenzyme A synthetase/AMP-(fatty) acid ligase